MTQTKETYSDPTGQALGVFDHIDRAESAQHSLVACGFAADDIILLHGADDADRIDTSREWFADTRDEVDLIKRRLRAGWTCVSVPVKDRASLKIVHDIFHDDGARFMTNFGTWITETESF